MRRLMLLRHAKTEMDAPSGRDIDRRLDDRGRSDADLVGKWLARQDARPARVLVSAATRAQQTWSIVAGALADAPDVVGIDSLYGAAPTELMRVMRDHGKDATTLMIVAHNPGLHELAIGMTRDGDANARRALGDNLPTGAIVILDFETEDWADAGFRRGYLIDLVSPKMLRSVEHEGS